MKFRLLPGITLAALLAGLLGLDGHRGVGDNHQALLGDEFAGGLTDAIGAVLDTDEGGAKVTDELLLTGGKFLILFFQQHIAALLEGLESGSGVGDIVLAAGHSLLQHLQILFCLSYLAQYQLLEFL